MPNSGATWFIIFALPVPVAIDWSPEHAEVLSDAAPPRRFELGSFVTPVAKSARELHHRVSTRAAQRDPVPTRGVS